MDKNDEEEGEGEEGEEEEEGEEGEQKKENKDDEEELDATAFVDGVRKASGRPNNLLLSCKNWCGHLAKFTFQHKQPPQSTTSQSSMLASRMLLHLALTAVGALTLEQRQAAFHTMKEKCGLTVNDKSLGTVPEKAFYGGVGVDSTAKPATVQGTQAQYSKFLFRQIILALGGHPGAQYYFKNGTFGQSTDGDDSALIRREENQKLANRLLAGVHALKLTYRAKVLEQEQRDTQLRTVVLAIMMETTSPTLSMDWGIVSKEIGQKYGTTISADALKERWDEIGSGEREFRTWTEDEDADMLHEMKGMGDVGSGVGYWKRLAGLLGNGRTHEQCRQHWCETLDPSIVKGTFSPKEDADMLQKMEGMGNVGGFFGYWTQLAASLISRRTSTQCSGHWHITLSKKAAKRKNDSLQQMNIPVLLLDMVARLKTETTQHKQPTPTPSQVQETYMNGASPTFIELMEMDEAVLRTLWQELTGVAVEGTSLGKHSLAVSVKLLLINSLSWDAAQDNDLLHRISSMGGVDGLNFSWKVVANQVTKECTGPQCQKRWLDLDQKSRQVHAATVGRKNTMIFTLLSPKLGLNCQDDSVEGLEIVGSRGGRVWVNAVGLSACAAFVLFGLPVGSTLVSIGGTDVFTVSQASVLLGTVCLPVDVKFVLPLKPKPSKLTIPFPQATQNFLNVELFGKLEKMRSLCGISKKESGQSLKPSMNLKTFCKQHIANGTRRFHKDAYPCRERVNDGTWTPSENHQCLIREAYQRTMAAL